MVFNETLALRLQKERGLADSTIESWRRTGKISDSYLNQSNMRVQGYFLSEARLKIELSQKDFCTQFSEFISKELGTETLVRAQHVSLWESGGSTPNKIYSGLLLKFYANEFAKKNIKPKPEVQAAQQSVLQ